MAQNDLHSPLVALIHHVQLNESGWWQQTIERVLIATLWIDNAPLTAEELQEAAFRYSGVALSHEDLSTALSSLKSRAEVFSQPDGRSKLAEATRQRFEQEVAHFEFVEKRAAEHFQTILRNSRPTLDATATWHAFRNNALIPVIHQLGAKTYALLQGHEAHVRDLEIVKTFLKSFAEDDRLAVHDCIRSFLSSNATDVRSFLLSQMTAIFCLEAGHLSKDHLDQLARTRHTKPEFILFLDTNFIYSLLGLHESTINATAVQLLSIAKAVSINIKLVVSPITVDEIRRNLRGNLYQVEQIQASPAIINVAQNHLTGVLQRYFAQAGTHATMERARQYFKPYLDDLVSILRDHSVELFNESCDRLRTREDVLSDIAERVDHEQKKYKISPRGYDAVVHDVVLWHLAADKRSQRVESPADAKYWVVTIDYRYLGWDSYKRRALNEPLQVCIHPTSLLQMLQFWVPRNAEMERALVDSMRLPFFYREFDAEAERVTVSILNALSRFENTTELSTDAVERIVVNNALRSRIALSDDEERQIEFVREALIDQNKALEGKLQTISKSLDEKLIELQNVRKEAAAQVDTLEGRLSDTVAQHRAEKMSMDAMIRELKNSQIRGAEATSMRRAKRLVNIITIVVIIAVGATSAVVYPNILRAWSSIEPLWFLISITFVIVCLITGFTNRRLRIRPALIRLFHRLSRRRAYEDAGLTLHE